MPVWPPFTVGGPRLDDRNESHVETVAAGAEWDDAFRVHDGRRRWNVGCG